MKHGRKWLLALIIAALAASLCLPLAAADDPFDENGLAIEYEPVAPEENVGEDGDEALEEDGEEPSVLESVGEGLEGTGLSVDGEGGAAGDVDGGAGEAEPIVMAELPVPTEQVFYPEGGLDEEAAAEGFIQRAMCAQPTRGSAMLRAAYAYGVGSRLTGADLQLYNALKALVMEVANGQRSNTSFEIPVKQIYLENHPYTAQELGLSSLYANGQPTAEAVYRFWDEITPDVGKVMRALMADCPYEMFWFDKTDGIRWLFADYEFVGDTIRIKNYDTDTVYFKFAVCKAYSAADAVGTYEINANMIGSVKTAAANAQAIVDGAVAMDDFEKLDYYRQQICDSVEYNYPAARGEEAYGDPWQMVYVFDGNPNTNVVCEGYSKAFQFLCDRTNFKGDIYAISVSGYMYNDRGSGGRHMWNLVNVKGVNYLVDLTNCDAGYADYLFMKGYSYVEFYTGGTTYYYQLDSKTLSYSYDTNVVNLYGDEALQVSDDPIGPADAQAKSGTAGNLDWRLSGSGLLYIRGEGPIPDYDENNPAPWPKDTIKRVTLSGGVTRIGERAFSGCPLLEQIIVPATVTSIADTAFDDCPNMIGEGHKGVIVYSCACAEVVDWVDTKIINHSVHHGENITIPGRAATCTQTGLTDGLRCKVCKKVLLEQEIIPALGHKPMTVNGRAATCTATGLTSGTKCATCGAWITAQRSIPAAGHAPVTVYGRAATCTATGLTNGTKCSKCGAILTAQRSIPAKGHAPVTVYGRAATCTASGLTNGTKCSTCGAILTAQQTIPAKGHAAQTIWGYAATCTAAGLTNGTKCSTCGAILTAQQTIPAKGHTAQTVYGRAATCTSAGLTNGMRCTTCGATLTAQQTIPAKGHSPVHVAGRAATYTSTGLTDGSYCAVCGSWLTSQQVIPAVPIRQIPLPNVKGNGTVTMTKGEVALLVPQFAGDAAVTGYTSAKPDRAAVDGAGVVTAQAEGKAKITVTTSNKKRKATVTIQVIDPYKPTGVSIAQGKEITVPVGQAFQLNAGLAPAGAQATLTWTSGKPGVATVDGNGWVNPVAEGKAKITVQTHNKKKASITVKVVDPYKPTGVSIAQGKAVTIKVGQALQLNAVLAPTGARSALTWTSKKPAVAAVDGGGIVRGVKKGKAKITVTTANRKKATITVNVVE